MATDRNTSARTNREIRVGTWNVNTLGQPGKFDNIKKEAKRLKVNIMGVSEVRWTGVGQLEDKNEKFIYSGRNTRNYGVGVLVSRELAGAITAWWPVSDRIIYVKIQGSLININLLQIYAPTTGHDDDEI